MLRSQYLVSKIKFKYLTVIGQMKPERLFCNLSLTWVD